VVRRRRGEAALQPGIARSQGLADIRDVTLAGNKDLADKVAAATGQLPALVSGLRDQSATRQTNRATAGQNLRDVLEGNNLKIAQEKYAAQKAGLTAGARSYRRTDHRGREGGGRTEQGDR